MSLAWAIRARTRSTLARMVFSRLSVSTYWDVTSCADVVRCNTVPILPLASWSSATSSLSAGTDRVSVPKPLKSLEGTPLVERGFGSPGPPVPICSLRTWACSPVAMLRTWAAATLMSLTRRSRLALLVSLGPTLTAADPGLDASAGAPGAKAPDLASGAPADASKPGSAAVSVGPKLTKSASLDLRVKDISVAAAQVRSIATGLQAQVLSEQIGTGGPGDPKPLSTNGVPSNDFNGFGTLTLSVPADKLDVALDQLANGKIGTVLQRTTSAQDVTSQYVDTESRLKTMRASVDRVRALMAQAKDIGQVVALEGEMSRREADLESLESQLAALKTSVERSTLAVSLSTPSNAGSRLPCTAYRSPRRARASVREVRKSTPTTSAPAAPIEASSSPVPTPK